MSDTMERNLKVFNDRLSAAKSAENRVHPVIATVTIQMWDGCDYLSAGNREYVNIEGILNSYPVEAIPQCTSEEEFEDACNDGCFDFVIFDAITTGYLAWDGPFAVSVPYDAYKEYLKTRGNRPATSAAVIGKKIDTIIDVNRLKRILDDTRVCGDGDVTAEMIRDVIVFRLMSAADDIAKVR